MKRVKHIVYITLLMLMFTCRPQSKVLAENPGGFSDTQAHAPIDRGLSILLAADVAYGAKKGYDKRKKDR